MNPYQEPKYEIKNGKLFNRQSGVQIPDDEPVFILRARDLLARDAIADYWRHVADNEHATAVYKRLEQFRKWAQDNADRMSSPTTQLTADWDNLQSPPGEVERK